MDTYGTKVATMKRHLRTMMTLGFGLAAALLILNTAATLSNIKRVAENSRWVAHTEEVLAELERTLSTVKDAETGQRGYLITGRQDYLEPYDAAVNDVAERLERLRALTADNQGQQEQVTRLGDTVERRLAVLAANISLRREKGLAAATEAVLAGTGKKDMDDIRKIVREMADTERSLLTARTRDTQAAISRTISTFTAVSASALLSIILLYIFISRHLALRQRSEQALRAEREWWKAVLWSVGDAVIVTDAHGRVAFMNPTAEALCCWPQDAAMKESLPGVFRIVNEVTRQEVESPVAKVLREGTVVGLANHTVLIARDGSERPIDDSAAPIRADDGSIKGVVLVFRDVSDRKRAEEALSQANRQSGVILESITDAFIALDADWHFTYVNAQAELIYGMKREELIGRNHWDVFPAAIGTTVDREFRRVVAERVSVDFENHYEPWDRWFGIKAYPAKDGSLAVYFQDITERKRGVQRLAESEARWRALLEAMPQLVWIDRAEDGSCVYMNSQWQAYTGVPVDDLLGYRWLDHLHPDDRERTAAAWEAAVADKAVYDIEYRIRRHDGAYGWFKTRGVPVRDERGSISIWYGTCTDIEDQKRTEEEIKRLLHDTEAAKADAEAANRMKDEFLAVLSHELRTPLNAIVGWAKILRSGKVDAEDLVEGLETIHRNANVQTQLVEDLLDISRIISGKLRLDVQRVNLIEVIDAAVAAVTPAADAKGIRLVKVLDSLAGTVSGDPARLQQVVWNLLSNAVKFTPRGGKVQVLLERVNSHVEISVIDTGQGISPDFLPHVFERFRQADSTSTRRFGGLGLGLAIVKQLVELHGGGVRAKSPGEGQGSTFVVNLSITTVHDGPEKVRPKAADRSEPDCTDQTLEGLRVLVVDDEPDARGLIRRVRGRRHPGRIRRRGDGTIARGPAAHPRQRHWHAGGRWL